MAHRHEVIVVGAGGAGLTAALYAAKEGGRNRVSTADQLPSVAVPRKPGER